MNESARLFLKKRSFPTPTRIPLDILLCVQNHTDHEVSPLIQFCVDYFDYRRCAVADLESGDGTVPEWLTEGLERSAWCRSVGEWELHGRKSIAYDPRRGFERTPRAIKRYDVLSWHRNHTQLFTCNSAKAPLCRLRHEGHDECIRMRERAEYAKTKRSRREIAKAEREKAASLKKAEKKRASSDTRAEIDKRRRAKKEVKKSAMEEKFEKSRRDNLLPPYDYACIHKYMYK